MSIVGGFDVHRKQITFDYLDTVTGEVQCGQIVAADRRRSRFLKGPVIRDRGLARGR
jgi:transposase